jgi:hypothetical protein
MLSEQEVFKIYKKLGKDNNKSYKEPTFEIKNESYKTEKNIESIIAAKTKLNKSVNKFFIRKFNKYNQEYVTFKIIKVNLIKKKKKEIIQNEEELGSFFNLIVRNEEEKENKIKNYEEEVTKKEKEEEKEENEIIASSYYNYYEGFTIFRIKFEDNNLIFILDNLQEIFIFDKNFDKYDTFQTNLTENKNDLSVFKKYEILTQTVVNITNFDYLIYFEIIEKEIDGFYELSGEQSLENISKQIIFSNLNNNLINSNTFKQIILEVKNNSSEKSLKELEQQIINNVNIFKNIFNKSELQQMLYLALIKEDCSYDFKKIKNLDFFITILSFGEKNIICDENLNTYFCNEYYVKILYNQINSIKKEITDKIDKDTNKVLEEIKKLNNK